MMGHKREKYDNSSIIILIPSEIKKQFVELCKSNFEDVSSRIREMIRSELRKNKSKK